MGCSKSKATAQEPKLADEQPSATILSEATAEEKAILQLKVVYRSLDSNADGAVSRGELAAGLAKDEHLGKLVEQAGLNPEFKVLEQLDSNADGRITWDEFEQHLKQAAKEEVMDIGNVKAVELPAEERAIQQLRKLYDSLDSNSDGAVSREELAAGLEQCEEVGKLVEEAGFNPRFYVLEQLDSNEDGRITWDEFEKHLREAAKEEVKERGDVAAAVEVELQSEEIEGDGAAVQPKGLFCCH